MAEWLAMAKVPGLLRPGQRVYVGGSSNEPRALVAAISSDRSASQGVTYIQQPLVINEHDFSSFHPEASQEVYFVTPALKAGLARGSVRFVPMQMRAVFDHIAAQPIDIALLGAARDAHGTLRFGPNVDYAPAALSAARCVVVEVSDAYTAPLGGLPVDESKVTYLVASSSPVMIYPSTDIDATSQQIGNHIEGLIRDGDCLQTGIGAVPAAVLGALGNKNDLGFHGGLIDDAVMQLIKAGNLNGNRKGIDRGRHLTGMALGSNALMAWLTETDAVQFRGADYTHEVSVIAQLDQFVSINSAVEIDLFGQVNAEMAGGRQVSGTGGSVDFMRAAKASKQGRSIVALTSTARNGTVSRIVDRVEMATALRTDVDIVVTEFGVAHLRNASVQDRAAQLINIAHPDFRDRLRESAQRVM